MKLNICKYSVYLIHHTWFGTIFSLSFLRFVWNTVRKEERKKKMEMLCFISNWLFFVCVLLLAESTEKYIKKRVPNPYFSWRIWTHVQKLVVLSQRNIHWNIGLAYGTFHSYNIFFCVEFDKKNDSLKLSKQNRIRKKIFNHFCETKRVNGKREIFRGVNEQFFHLWIQNTDLPSSYYVSNVGKIDASDSHSIFTIWSSLDSHKNKHDKNNIFLYNFPFILIDRAAMSRRWKGDRRRGKDERRKR